MLFCQMQKIAGSIITPSLQALRTATRLVNEAEKATNVSSTKTHLGFQKAGCHTECAIPLTGTGKPGRNGRRKLAPVPLLPWQRWHNHRGKN